MKCVLFCELLSVIFAFPKITYAEPSSQLKSEPDFMNKNEIAELGKAYLLSVKSVEKYFGRKFKVQGRSSGDRSSFSDFKMYIEWEDAKGEIISAWCSNTIGFSPVEGEKVVVMGVFENYTADEAGISYYLKDCKIERWS